MSKKFKYPGTIETTNGNQLVAKTEGRIAECGVFYPITPSTEQGENFENSVSQGTLTVFGDAVKAIETEGEHAAQGGAIAMSTTGKRTSNFTSGQGIVYGLEQYYHAPGKLSTMVLNVGARALTRHALNVHCGHDDIYAAMDTGWTMVMAKDAQQAVDQTMILRKVNELSLNPGMNIQDGFLTTHLERTFRRPESALIREFLGHPSDTIKTPTEDQKELFGETRRRIPIMYNLEKPILLGSVQNQEHYMSGVISRRLSFNQHILKFLEDAYTEFGDLTGRYYGLISEYNTKGADTVFLSIGSSAENLEAAADYIKKSKNETMGVAHLNVMRPFPEEAIIKLIKGRKNIVILERTDEGNAGAGPIARDVRTAITKAQENARTGKTDDIGQITLDETPRIFEGVYGLGSRDFRPEHSIGAYEFVNGKTNRQDGKSSEKEHFFYLGVNHPYAVVSKETPSLLPDNAIAIRMHSIGGWGAITTGKNMAEILGTLSQYSVHAKDKKGEEIIHISANPKYGSEKKGAPTNYFLVAADERVRVNCDLKHVNVVLCCDPKAFIHTNPLAGMAEGGSFIWESDEDADAVWTRIPKKYRQEVIDKKIKIYTLAGFDIARNATKNESLQTRMQGNSFLGAFFAVSPFLKHHQLDSKTFIEAVHNQYKKKFGRFGEDVVASNLTVMQSGFERIKEVPYGDVNAEDRSAQIGKIILPMVEQKSCEVSAKPTEPIYKPENYEREFSGDLKHDQPASALISTGIITAATGAKNSKFVARIKTPVYNAYNCTQCMECIDVCPDTALPNTAQDIDTLVGNIFKSYVTNADDAKKLTSSVDAIVANVRAGMNKDIDEKKKEVTPFHELLLNEVKGKVSDESYSQIEAVATVLPIGYGKTKMTYQMLEKKQPGQGGIFSIFVNDLCKGCGECVTACGDHNALTMVEETEDIRSKHLTATAFMKTLPTTPQKFLGKYDPENLEEARAAILSNHLMVQDNYNALVAGDGSCAGCGEKSVLRGITTMTEALMRPVFDNKASRLTSLSAKVKLEGAAKLANLKQTSPEAYEEFRLTLVHLLLNKGGDDKTEAKVYAKEFKGDDNALIDALVMILGTEGTNHRKLHLVEGNYEGMSVMGMTASTGCNSVYGSSHPANPHSYPWMNSLFQDGATIGWLVGEGFMSDHIRKSVIPERLANLLFSDEVNSFSDDDYFNITHMTDAQLTDLEILETPKVWCVGGDGAFGDIGFQNVSKVIQQNRPNVHVLMLDTQVYSNTGGQNSDSSIMPGGFDMNQFGRFSEGKLTERKEVAQIMATHGSAYSASVSMANAAAYFKAVLDGLLYRGTAYIQAFTSCQPEHAIADDVSATQALRIRDARGVPEFVFNPQLGETEQEAFNVKGNPRSNRDWASKKDADKNAYDYTIVQWAATEGRFKKHFYKLKPEDEVVNLNDLVLRMSQNDVVYRRYLNKDHRAYIPNKGIYADIVDPTGKVKRMGVSKHLVLFTVERRKAWRMLQSKAGLTNVDYAAQKELLKRFDAGEITKEDFANTYEQHQKIVAELS